MPESRRWDFEPGRGFKGEAVGVDCDRHVKNAAEEYTEIADNQDFQSPTV